MQYGAEFESTLVAALLCFLLVAGFYAVRPAEERRALMVIALVSYLLKAALVPIYFWVLIKAGFEGTAFGSDPIGTHTVAELRASSIRAGTLPPELSGWGGLSLGYPMYCAYLYAWFGPNTLVPRIFNTALSSLSLLYLYRLAKIYFDQKVARLAVLLTAFLPYTMLITLEMRKDPMAQFLALFVLYHAALLTKADRRWPRSLLFIALGLVPMYSIRTAFVLPFLALVSISFVAMRQNILMAAAAAVPVLLLVGAMQFSVPEESQLSMQANVERLEGKLQRGKLVRETGLGMRKGGLLHFAQISSPKQLWKMPLSAALVLITPFPPSFPPRFPHLLYQWSNLICLVMYPWLFMGVLSVLREKGLRERALLLLFPGVFLILIGALHPSVTRYRETVFPIILLLIAVGFHRPFNLIVTALTYAALAGLALVVYAARLS